MELVTFLKWAGTGPGINVIIGVALSFVVEWVPGYDSLQSRVKRLVVMGASFIVPVVSLVLLLLLGEVVFSWNLFYLAVAAGFTEFFGSQMAHARRLVPVADAVRPGFEDEGKMLFGE